MPLTVLNEMARRCVALDHFSAPHPLFAATGTAARQNVDWWWHPEVQFKVSPVGFLCLARTSFF